ncbi:hypothetical protein ND861_06910 [Leptospira sp. 2 VSF19]|uniref:Peptidase MA family protein n=1 Tax=Leptospira soteropolitanensis TaxID=2950025 RepID=A0AAW5VDY5_9LEPT|nr:hypothetical protein [Leptospira soteropolitanensis]MCW7492380.1 hypothetical protein [Leptospira soteropolitanensis]MCW7499960.1 hypothetical protein [Leptospira soteropolitanensis]MCW7522212.1 hypothetical protein [Leptospira soteropolitanensis]MCW7526067.1 hypothetical protein [Leptospira soteropolitanensis]MCW7529821.1 hypothetical protein [Leptospira soteropolitanensis]
MPNSEGPGVTIGQFAVTRGTDESTLRHETAHLQQYKEWGPYRYLSVLGSSPAGGGGVGENDADLRGGTFAYNATYTNRMLSGFALAFRPGASYDYNSRQAMTLFIYLGYMP